MRWTAGQSGARRGRPHPTPFAFSRKQSLAYRPVDVDTLLSGMVDLPRRTPGERIDISTALGAESSLARVEASASDGEVADGEAGGIFGAVA